MKHDQQSGSGKQTVTLSISEDLIAAARLRNIDLSEALEASLCRKLGEQNGPDFCESYAAELSDKKKDIASLKQYGETHGLFET